MNLRSFLPLPAPFIPCYLFCLFQAHPLLVRNKRHRLSSCHPPQHQLPNPFSVLLPKGSTTTLSMPEHSSSIQKIEGCPNEKNGQSKALQDDPKSRIRERLINLQLLRDHPTRSPAAPLPGAQFPGFTSLLYCLWHIRFGYFGKLYLKAFSYTLLPVS